MRSNLFTSLIITALTMALPIVSFGADQEQAKQSAAIQATASTKMTPELKKDMADMHQRNGGLPALRQVFGYMPARSVDELSCGQENRLLPDQ
jgi:hypothetical protein